MASNRGRMLLAERVFWFIAVLGYSFILALWVYAGVRWLLGV